jgi:internalin A
VDENLVSDASPVASLGLLNTLNLSGNRLSSLSALTSLSQLSELQAEGNAIKNLAPLISLPALKWAFLRNNPIDCQEQAENLARLKAQVMDLRTDCSS